MFLVLYGAAAAGIGMVLLVLALLQRRHSPLALPAVAVMAAFLINMLAETAIGAIVVMTRDYGDPHQAEYALQVISFFGVYAIAIAASWLATRLFPFPRARSLLAAQIGAELSLFALLLATIFVPTVRVGSAPVMLLLDIPVTLVFLAWAVAGAIHLIRMRDQKDEILDRHRRTIVFAIAVIPVSLAIDLYSLPQRLGLIDSPVSVSPLLICGLGLAVVYATRTSEPVPRSGGAWRAELSEREQEVALMLAEGRAYADIAQALFIAPSTVKTHVLRIYRKLGVANKTELSRMVQAS